LAAFPSPRVRLMLSRRYRLPPGTQGRLRVSRRAPLKCRAPDDAACADSESQLASPGGRLPSCSKPSHSAPCRLSGGLMMASHRHQMVASQRRGRTGLVLHASTPHPHKSRRKTTRSHPKHYCNNNVVVTSGTSACLPVQSLRSTGRQRGPRCPATAGNRSHKTSVGVLLPGAPLLELLLELGH
jgi:hypothetical protein